MAVVASQSPLKTPETNIPASSMQCEHWELGKGTAGYLVDARGRGEGGQGDGDGDVVQIQLHVALVLNVDVRVTPGGGWPAVDGQRHLCILVPSLQLQKITFPPHSLRTESCVVWEILWERSDIKAPRPRKF